MGMEWQRQAEVAKSAFDRQKRKVELDSLDMGELRRYFDGRVFTPVMSDIYPGHEQPFHRHERTVEWVVVLEGEIAFIEGDREIIVPAGDAVLFTPDPTEFHTMANKSDRLARYITVKAPLHDVPLSVMERDRIVLEE